MSFQNDYSVVNRTYILPLFALNLLLATFIITTFDQKFSLVNGQQLDTNATETAATKANATETAATKANATETAATKANATETAATKDSLKKTEGNKDVKFCYNSQFGSLGTGDGQFIRPHDIVFDSKGFLYINDRELNNFQKFSSDGKFISKFGEKGEELGQFKSPYSMAMDSNDNIYVLDRGNDRVQKVSTDGTPLGALYSYDGVFITSNDDIAKADQKDKKPSKEEKLKQFASPEAMAIDKEGNFYVTDTGHNRIIKFDKNFKYLSHYGQEGSGPGQFNHPHGIGVDSDGNILINELNNARIQKFTNDGKFIKQWGSEGKGPGQFTLPLEHLKVDKNDNVFITDGEDNPRVQVFDNDGNFLTQFGKLGVGNGEFQLPEHVAFNEKDDKETVYVVDRGNARIQTFLPC
jgi:sugar lactone lactonase YvrE